jgi:hypothetical protein
MALLRAAAWLCLACSVGAQPYSLQQAKASKTFLAMTKDVLSVIAPSIDPLYKLAAQGSVTLDSTNRALYNLFSYTFNGHRETSKIVQVRQVLTFSLLVGAPSAEALRNFIAPWAENIDVPSENILVTWDTSAPIGQDLSRRVYNVTLAPRRDSSWTADLLQTPEKLLRLLRQPPATCITDDPILTTAQNGCRTLCEWFTNVSNANADVQLVGNCPAQTVLRSGIGYRYVLDFFSAFSTSNLAVAQTVAEAEVLMTPGTLQYQLPIPLPEAGTPNRIGTLIATFVTSGIVVVGMYYSRTTSKDS